MDYHTSLSGHSAEDPEKELLRTHLRRALETIQELKTASGADALVQLQRQYSCTPTQTEAFSSWHRSALPPPPVQSAVASSSRAVTARKPSSFAPASGVHEEVAQLLKPLKSTASSVVGVKHRATPAPHASTPTPPTSVQDTAEPSLGDAVYRERVPMGGDTTQQHLQAQRGDDEDERRRRLVDILSDPSHPITVEDLHHLAAHTSPSPPASSSAAASPPPSHTPASPAVPVPPPACPRCGSKPKTDAQTSPMTPALSAPLSCPASEAGRCAVAPAVSVPTSEPLPLLPSSVPLPLLPSSLPLPQPTLSDPSKLSRSQLARELSAALDSHKSRGELLVLASKQTDSAAGASGSTSAAASLPQGRLPSGRSEFAPGIFPTSSTRTVANLVSLYSARSRS